MKLSREGYRLIKSFEGYHARRKDGSCEAYLCPAGVPTIGFGCTEGVKLGTVWSEAKAEQMLKKEISKFEAGVSDLVKVPINQNEYDACVSFAYNCGLAGFGRSTILKRLNKGDRLGASRAFMAWTKGGGRVLPGLVARRDREAALFLKPMEAPSEPYMPQSVTEAKPPVVDTKTAVGTAVGAGTAVIAPSLPIPEPPAAITETVTNLSIWQSMGDNAWMLKQWAIASPHISIPVGLLLMSIWFGPQLYSKIRGAV